MIANLLVVVRHNQEIWYARCYRREVSLQLGRVGSASLEYNLDVIELFRGEVLAEVGVDAGLVLQRREETLRVGSVVVRWRRRRVLRPPPCKSQDEEDEKETAQ